MQQEYGIVHGGGQLHDVRNIVGDKGDLPQCQVGSLIDGDGAPDDGQEENRLKIGGGRCQKNQENEGDRHGQDHFHLPLHIFLCEFVGGRHADDISPVPEDLFDIIDGAVGQPAGISLREGDVHHGAVVLVVLVDGGIIDEIRGGVDLVYQVAPDNLVHALHLFHLVLVLLCLIQRDILQHDAAGARIAEGVLHHIDSLLRIGVVRQIGCQIIIYAHKGDAQNRHHNQSQDNPCDSPVVLYNHVGNMPAAGLIRFPGFRAARLSRVCLFLPGRYSVFQSRK